MFIIKSTGIFQAAQYIMELKSERGDPESEVIEEGGESVS